MSWILLASVAIPVLGAGLVATTSIGRDARRADRARSVAVWSSGITLLASIVVLVGVAADGRVDLVAENDDGRALFGLTAARIEASLLVLTSFVGLIVQSYASRSLRGDGRAVRFHGHGAEHPFQEERATVGQWFHTTEHVVRFGEDFENE